MGSRTALRSALIATFLSTLVASPAFPAASSLVATPVSSSGIDLRWSGPTQGYASFGIDRSLSATSGFVRIATVGRVLSYQDRGLTAGRTYFYRVTDLRLGGTSNVAAATTFGGIATTSTTRTTTSTTRPSTTSTTLGSSAPVANAGPDQFTQTLTTLKFNGSGSFDPGGTITSYAWTFGDGTGAAGMAPTHAYASPGTYMASLTVTDNSGLKGTDTAVVSVANRPPSANAGPDKTAAVGAVVSFSGGWSDVDGVVTSSTWMFGDGAAANGATASHTYATAGTYVASFTVVDDRGAVGTDTAVVTVGTPSAGGGQVLWGKLLGGTGIDSAYGVAVDPSGNVIVIGRLGAAADLGGGAVCPSSSMFVLKFSPTGSLLWWRCPGGNVGGITGRAVAFDGNGNVLITGSFTGTVDFGGGPFTAGGYGQDIFLVKYSAAGGHVWSRRFGASSPYLLESGYAVAVDSLGDVVMTGAFDGAADFGGGLLTSAGSTDVFVAKFSGANGVHLWSRRAGTAGWNDSGNGVAIDAGGNVVVTGTASGYTDFGGGPLPGTDLDIFVVKYTAAGAHVWSRSFGSISAVDAGNAVGVDANGNIVLAGTFTSMVDFGSGMLFTKGDSDAFLAKFSPFGTPLWSRSFGSRYADSAAGVAVTTSGDIVIAGSFVGAVDFGAGSLSSLSFSIDIFVAKYSGTGTALWSSRLGGSSPEVAYALGLNRNGHLAVAGSTISAAVDFGDGARPNAGVWDGLLADLAP